MPDFLALVKALLSDPRSRLQAVVAGWQYPLSRESMNTLDLMDLLLQRWSEQGKYRPATRPWDAVKPGKKRSVEDAMRILRPHKFTQDPPS